MTCSSMSRRPCAGLGNKIRLTKLKLSNKIKLTKLIKHVRIRGFFFENVIRKSKGLLKLQRRRTAIAIQKLASCLDTEYNFLLPSRSRRGRSPPCRTRMHTRHKSKMSHWRTSISGGTQLLTRRPRGSRRPEADASHSPGSRRRAPTTPRHHRPRAARGGPPGCRMSLCRSNVWKPWCPYLSIEG